MVAGGGVNFNQLSELQLDGICSAHQRPCRGPTAAEHRGLLLQLLSTTAAAIAAEITSLFTATSYSQKLVEHGMEAAMLNAEVEKQLAQLQSEDMAVQGRALAMITVLFSRCENESQVSAVAAAVPSLYSCLESPDQLVQANACAALTAASALDDQLAASVAAQATKQLVSLLQQCCSDDRADLQLNVVSALGQLARDQQMTAQAVMEPQVLPCLLGMAVASQPSKLQEAVADCLCALASNEWAKQQLCAAGAVTAASGLLDVQQLEVSVRCLMVLGMLLSSSADAQQQLADDAAALQQLMELLKQNEDADCKVFARDVLGLLMRDEGLRGKVEAAIRQQAEAAAAAAAQQEPNGAVTTV